MSTAQQSDVKTDVQAWLERWRAGVHRVNPALVVRANRRFYVGGRARSKSRICEECITGCHLSCHKENCSCRENHSRPN